MPRHCSAGGCKSRDNRETRNAGVTFHKLPKEAGRRSLWITNSQRADSWDPRTDFVYFCSRHFSPDSFELTGCSGIRRLKEDAFPTVFERPPGRTRRQGRPLKPQHRKRRSSGGQENAQPETGKSPTVVRAASPLPPPGPEDRPQGTGPDKAAAPSAEAERPPDPRSVSPSRYMRRLPPPPGFYLPKEHSYAQLCPLLWRRRYDQAIDCLERALRQLHAARRRENRLRSTVLRLRDRRLKHTLLLARETPRSRGGCSPGGAGGRRGGRGGFAQEDHAKCEEAAFEDRCVDLELGGWSEDRGHCFYCGRGPAQGVCEPGGDRDPAAAAAAAAAGEDPLDAHGGAHASQSARDIRIIRVEGAPLETTLSTPSVLLQTQPLPFGVPAGPQHTLQFRDSQLEQQPPPPPPPLSDPCHRDSEASGPEHRGDLQQQQQQQQQLLWIQDNGETQLILVPLHPSGPTPADDALHGLLRMEGLAQDAQPLVVSELGGGAPSALAISCEGKHPAATREDVREKLKEHLEGFHLQLSTEFQT